MKQLILGNLKYIISLIITIFIFLCIKYFFGEYIVSIDNYIYHIIHNDNIYEFLNLMNILTNFGEEYTFIIILIVMLLINKKDTIYEFINLIFTFLVNVLTKNLFMRQRPVNSLIELPSGFSFPSGHTMCSVSFYGFLIFLIIKKIQNKYLKIFSILFLIMLILIVAFSRIYLKVHYFTDVVGGLILGIICLLMIINIYKKELNKI